MRVKLRNTQLAIRAAEQAGDARLLAQYERSAQALKAVLPPLKTPGDITSKVGIMAALRAGSPSWTSKPSLSIWSRL